MFKVNDKVSFLGGDKVYRIKKVYWDGALEAQDEEGDVYTFEKSEYSELKKVNKL